jgi:quinol-cytochrome oxidoreductase complex cytochrome b subunit
MSALRKWLDIRTGLAEPVRTSTAGYRVPRDLVLVFYTLRTVAFVAIVVQIITGIILLFYYVPQH